MRGAGRWAVRTLVAAALMAGTVALSHVPWAAAPGSDGALRLAWRYRSPQVNACRRLPAEELARLPAHMRQPISCERGLATYVLAVAVDGRTVALDTVRARGAEADRPLSIFREIGLPVGPHAVRVVFAPLAAGGAEAQADGLERRPIAPTFVLDTTFVLQRQRVALVTLDEARGALLMPR